MNCVLRKCVRPGRVAEQVTLLVPDKAAIVHEVLFIVQDEELRAVDAARTEADPRRQADATRHRERHPTGVDERLAVGDARILEVLGQEDVQMLPGGALGQRIMRLLRTAEGDDPVVGDEKAVGAVRVADRDVVGHLHATALQPEAVAAVADVQRLVVGVLGGDGSAVVVAGVESRAVGADGEVALEAADFAAVLREEVGAADLVRDIIVHQAVAAVVDDAELRAADHGAVADDERRLLVGGAPADVEVQGVAADGVGVAALLQLAVLDT